MAAARLRALAAGMVVAGAVAACGGTTPETGLTAGPTACSLVGADTATRTGAPVLASGAAHALLRNVQVQASACADAVVLYFWQGTPGYSVRYRSGTSQLVVRLSPVTTDTAGDPTYEGPTTIRPAAPAQVRELRGTGESSAALSWTIAVDAVRPFTVTRTDDALVVRVRADAPRPTRCSLDGATVTYPPGWFAELTPPWACRFYDAGPFVVQPQTNATTWAVSVATSSTPYAEAVAQWTAGPTARVLATRGTTVGGRRAVAVETESTGAGMLPAGWRSYAYVVDRGGNGTLTVSVTPGPPGAAYAARKAAADGFAAGLQV